MHPLRFLCAATMAAALTSPAFATIITFDSLPTGPYTAGSSATESGFVYTVSSGPGGIAAGELYVAPDGITGNDVEGFYPATPGNQTGYLTITAADGGTFVFNSLQWAEVGPGGGGGPILSYYVGGLPDGGAGAGAPATISYSYSSLAGPGSTDHIDTLVIEIPAATNADLSHTYTAIDNIDLTEDPTVASPEPASIAITGMALAGLASVRRRRRRV